MQAQIAMKVGIPVAVVLVSGLMGGIMSWFAEDSLRKWLEQKSTQTLIPILGTLAGMAGGGFLVMTGLIPLPKF